MLLNGEVIGVRHRSRADPGQFPDKLVALLQTFADQAVIAIENARLFNETQEALEQQTATAKVLRVISGSPTDVQPVFEAIVERCKRLLRRRCRRRSSLTTATPCTWSPSTKVGDEAIETLQAAFPAPVDAAPAAGDPRRAASRRCPTSWSNGRVRQFSDGGARSAIARRCACR